MGVTPATAATRIGLLGGSFDPIHEAHLALADTALAHLHAHSVQLIPAAAPWQRQPLAASAEHRAAMVELAIANRPGLELNRIELERGGPSYTIDTIRTLAAAPPGTPLAESRQYIWVLGADQLTNFCTWKDWQDIVALADLAVAGRPGTQPEPPVPLQQALHHHRRRLYRLPMHEMPVSSSAIRQRLANGQSVEGLVPPAVLQYIHQHGLYQV